ncbi:MAG: hemolysin III family protein [Dehalococcoidia bacterium]|nr:hemolysin III family protein [Dehalococcoidia bacterium]
MIATAVAAPVPPRPLLRGAFHLAAAALAPFGLVLLLRRADSPRDYVAAAIFGAMLLACFAVSASYHMVPWPALGRGVMKRLDHAMIFALIAGTYTPFCLLVLDGAWGIALLAVVWSLAGVGMLLKLAWPSAPRWLSVGGYLAVGWLALVASAPLASALALAPLLLLLLGGAMYSLGGVVYALRRPDPFPRVFGYHEVFHVLVVGAAGVHFAVVVHLIG